MKRKNSLTLKLKFWGSSEAIEKFQKHLDDNFICFISPIKPSDQGNYHAYATIEVGEE